MALIIFVFGNWPVSVWRRFSVGIASVSVLWRDNGRPVVNRARAVSRGMQGLGGVGSEYFWNDERAAVVAMPGRDGTVEQDGVRGVRGKAIACRDTAAEGATTVARTRLET